MLRSRHPLLLLSALTLTTGVWAQTPEKAPAAGASFSVGGSTEKKPSATAAATATSAPVPAPKVDETEIPRDPKGVVGISPFWEAINKGDTSFLAQDVTAATDSYQGAITLEPHNPIGHLRMAELVMKQAELIRAQEFIVAAIRFSETNIRHKAQASFLLAELRERQKSSDDAIDSWRAYKLLDGQLPGIKPEAVDGKAPAPLPQGQKPLPPTVYIATADARTAAIEAAKKLVDEYAGVRERIAKKIAEAEKATGGK